MKEPKDLFGLIEEDLAGEKKQEESFVLPNPIITQQEPKEIKEANAIENIPLLKKKKKHFRYKDGKIQYMNAFSERLRDVLRGDVRKSDRSVLLRNIAAVIIVFSIALFFLILKDEVWFLPSSQENNPPSGTETIQSNPSGGDSAMSLEEMMETLQGINAKEIEKVEKYLDIKSNRVSTIAEINDAKKEKESLYLSFLESEEAMTKEEFATVEAVIVRSVGMSKELLMAFESSQGNEKIREIINQYTKGGN